MNDAAASATRKLLDVDDETQMNQRSLVPDAYVSRHVGDGYVNVTHDDDPDVPVLPQYMVDKITDLAEGRSIAGAAKPDGLSKGRPFKVCQHT